MAQQTSPRVLGAQGVAASCQRRGAIRRLLERALRDGGTFVAPCFTHMGHKRNRPDRLAEKLLQIRKALGLTQKEMAERLSKQAGVKITYRNVSKYERDKSVPYIEIVLAYARLANVEMNQIVDDDLDIEPTEWPEFIEADLT